MPLVFGGFLAGHSVWIRGLRSTLVRVELFLDRRLRVPHIRIAFKLRVAELADSTDGNVPDALDDPKLAFWHEASFPQRREVFHLAEIPSCARPVQAVGGSNRGERLDGRGTRPSTNYYGRGYNQFRVNLDEKLCPISPAV